MKHVLELLTTILDKGQTCASFHAQKQLPRLDSAAIVVLLPILVEKAMIKHGWSNQSNHSFPERWFRK